MPATPAERRELRKGCTLVVPDFATGSAADDFRALAAWCEANRIDHDSYGEGELVEGFERKVAALLGKAAAMFAPSGVMAQLAAVKIHAEAAGVDRFGMHPTSHLAHHEEQAYAALMHCHGVPVGNRLRPMRAGDLETVRETLACVLVELPIREAGGQLPSWEELEALKAAARERRVPLHMDGARLWESAAYYGKDYATIAAGFDSVYVSVYKGIGGFAGALLAGDDAFIAKARVWRRRLGDERRVAGEQRAGEAAEPLVDRDVDRVEAGGDGGVVAAIERRAFPEACAVHVQGDAPLARGGLRRLELVPGGELAAGLADRQLDVER